MKTRVVKYSSRRPTTRGHAAPPGRYHRAAALLRYRKDPIKIGSASPEKYVPSSSGALSCSATHTAVRCIVWLGMMQQLIMASLPRSSAAVVMAHAVRPIWSMETPGGVAGEARSSCSPVCGSPCSRDGCRRLIPAFVVEDMQPALVGIGSTSGLTSVTGGSTWLARIGSYREQEPRSR